MDLSNRLQNACGHLAAQVGPRVAPHATRTLLRAHQQSRSSPPQTGSAQGLGWSPRCERLSLQRVCAISEEDEGAGGAQPTKQERTSLYDIEVGAIYKARVVKIVPFGAFVDIGAESDGLVHISEISEAFVTHVEDVLEVGQIIRVKIIGAEPENRRISCSIRALPIEQRL